MGDQITWDPSGNTTTGKVSKYNSTDTISIADVQHYQVIVTAVAGDTSTIIVAKSGTT